ncbi:protein MIZU-KUSSEI 1-like [Magnolia sinica]|uniref:protein MIZU-KUSSEI 1-like n=1 Tax=Magnolia sinica TaxID=86752 RepID=UPI00265A2199|nr:protein MIZU-KUSSEI 1-like [Magnolia sinica]
MKVIDFLHRSLFSCCSSSNSLTTQRKKRIPKIKPHNHHQPSQPSPSPSSPFNLTDDKNPPPPSKSNVIGTIFGHRRARARFCIQHDSHISKPLLLLELPMPTYLLAEEMKSDLLRISLECHRSQIASCSLHSVPIWTMYCNGRKVGFAARRRATDKDRDVLRTVQATSFGAGVIPPTSDGEEEVMYMRASYERVVGSGDSESFHLINTGRSPSQELSVFLLRTE